MIFDEKRDIQRWQGAGAASKRIGPGSYTS